MNGRWTDIDPTKYDEVHEIRGLELQSGYFISPFDVPDGVRLNCSGQRTGQKSYLIELRYLTDREKVEMTETELPEVHLGLGRNSSRLVSLRVVGTEGLPKWERMESLLSKLTSQRNVTNHYVARSVLRDSWAGLLRQVRELGF